MATLKFKVPGYGDCVICEDTDGGDSGEPYVWIEKSNNGKCSGKGKISRSDAIVAIQYLTEEDKKAIWEEALLTAENILDDRLEANPLLELRFLHTCISILYETGRRFVDKPDLLQDLVYLYWNTWREVSPSDDDPSALSVDVCEQYLNLLTRDSNHDWFEKKVKHDKPDSSREQETREVTNALKGLLKASRKKEKNNSDFTDVERDKKKRIEQVLGHGKDRLMAWYALSDGVDIAVTLQKSWLPSCLRRFVAGWLPEILMGAVLGYIIMFRYSNMLHFTLWNRDVFLLLLYVFMGCALVIFAVQLFSRKKTIDFQIYLPRMAAGIVVGYLALLSDEAWGGIFCISNGPHSAWLIVGRVILPVVAVILYILIEMNNVKGIEYPIGRKALRLFARGAAYAVLVAIMISDLFGRAIVARILETSDLAKKCASLYPVPLRGLFGNVYPEVIFFLAPLALFIGVFVQLLWEDKTLTAKI